MKLRQPISNGRGHDNGNKWYWIHKNDVGCTKTAVAYTKKRAAYTNQQADFQTDKQSVYAVYAKTKNIFHTKRINTQKSCNP